MQYSAPRSCLVPKRLSLDKNLHKGRREEEKRASPPFFSLPMVPCALSPVTRVSRSPVRCETMLETRRLRRRQSQKHLKTMVYAIFGGQTECIMGHSKIENCFLTSRRREGMHVKRERRRIITKIREIQKWWDRIKLLLRYSVQHDFVNPTGKTLQGLVKDWMQIIIIF